MFDSMEEFEMYLMENSHLEYGYLDWQVDVATWSRGHPLWHDVVEST